MKRILIVLSGLLALTAVSAFANELDPTTTDAPLGIIVRADQNGARDVFKADGTTVANDTDAALAVQNFVTTGNQITNVTPLSELDTTTSDGAWCSWYHPYYYGGYGYSYYYNYGYSYSYYPYYSYSYSNYYYYYYYRY